MTIDAQPAAQLLNIGVHEPEYVIVLNGIPAETTHAVLICNDFDTPSCRSRAARTVEEVKDPFLQQLLETGSSLESLHARPCPFVHLLACDVPLRGRHETLQLAKIGGMGVSGINTSGQLGFYPPSPPEGDPAVHRYQLRVVLLRHPLGLKEGFSADELDLALRQANPAWLVGECHAEMRLTAAQLRMQRGRSGQD